MNVDDRDRLAWILRHRAELDRRYQNLRSLLDQVGSDETVEINLLDFDLAQADLAALVNAMMKPEELREVLLDELGGVHEETPLVRPVAVALAVRGGGV